METPLFLGYATAAFIHSHRGASGLRKTHALPAKGMAPPARQIKEARALLRLPEEARIDTCVWSDNDKRVGAGQRPHKCRYAVIGDYLSFGNGIYVSSPELTFLQCAEMLSPQELVMLGFELCGTFASPDGEFSRTKPICSKQKLNAYVSEHAGERGTGKARRALPYIADNSASPRESQLTALLCMPQKWGGYGFPLPCLNPKVGLDPKQRRVLGKSHLYCDLLWESSKLAIEYDSDAFHAGATKINDDSLRRNILRATGITVIDITNAQLKNAEALHEIAIQIDCCSGSRLIEKRKENWTMHNRDLRHLVLTQRASDRLL